MKNFMSGKKKITAFLMAIAVAAINTFSADPAQAEGLMELATQYLPTVFAFGLSFFYTKGEVKVDVEREKTRQSEANGVIRQTLERIHEVEQEVKPIIEQHADPFDSEEFAGVDDRKLKNKAAQTYIEVTPVTVFFTAKDKGRSTRCKHIDQSLSYWDFLRTKVLQAFEYMFGFSYAKAENHLADDNKACPYYSVENMARQKGIHYWAMLRNVRDIMRTQAYLEALSDSDIDWTQKLSPRDHTLLNLGNQAVELLRHNE